MDIGKFLLERGGLDLLFLLSNSPLGFNELKGKIRISPNTLLIRIKNATKLGLVAETLVKTNRRSLIKYTLTKDGQKELNSLKNIKRKYEKLKELLNEQEEKKRDTETEIKELLSSINKTKKPNINISSNKISRSKNVNINIENKE